MRRGLIYLTLVVSMLALGGCISANMVAEKIVTAPNGGQPHAGRFAKVADAFYTHQLKVTAGPAPATLSVAVIAPRNYGFSASEKRKQDNRALELQWEVRNNPTREQVHEPGKMQGQEALRYLQNMLDNAIPKLAVCRPTGTVILLPGWGETRETLLGYALDLASHGYRVALVDLRGQGQSSGHYVT